MKTKKTVKKIKKATNLKMSSGISNTEVLVVLVIAMLVAGTSIYLGLNYEFPFNVNTNSNTSDDVGSGTTVSESLLAQKELKKFEDYDQLNDFLDERAGSESSYYRSYWADVTIEESAVGESLTQDYSAKEASPSDFSTTNIQVEGVDEADIVKSDGDYIYVVSRKNLYIIDAYPADQAQIVSTIAFHSTPQDIYINEDYLVVYGTESSVLTKPFFESIRDSSTYTFFKVFDVKDRVNPKQVRDLEFEGTYVNSRMIGDYVYFITSQPSYGVYDDYPVPMVVEDDELVSSDPSAKGCLCPDVYYVDVPYTNYNFTSVTAINVTDNNKKINSEVYLLSGTENMYVSENNIYIAYTKYVSESQLELEVLKEIVMPMLETKDRQRIQDIEDAPAHVLNQVEKLTKIGLIIERYTNSLSQTDQVSINQKVEEKLQAKYDDIYKELEKTVIHKIELNNDKLSYKATGEVTGQVLNQFAMDEHDDYFRIATTKNSNWSWIEDATTDSYNNVYVLDEDLEIVGKVENLAEGERIYSARFMQGRVYLVTFRQVDPLYAIDLSNPKSPKVLDMLKVPGFSSYLHPYDSETLIGFGKQADEDGRIQGLKISLFDVSDVENMKEIDTYEMGDSGSESIALTDHKAFLFSKDKNLLVVPVSLRKSYDEETFVSTYTRGAMVFSITEDGIEFRDQINHSDGSNDSSDYYYGYQYYDTTVKRSLYIDDTLYTISNLFVKSNSLDDLSVIKEIDLATTTSTSDFDIIN